MKIQPIQNCQYINKNFYFKAKKSKSEKQEAKIEKRKNSHLAQLTQELLIRADLENLVAFNKFINQKGRVKKEEYDTLKENHFCAINKAFKHFTDKYKGDITPEISAKTAYFAKKACDRVFGENSYRIISIGTSPAPLTQPMKLLGCEVIHVPLSGLKELDYSDNENRNANLSMKYAKLKGMDDKKINIITDYESTGISFIRAIDLFKKNFSKARMWGISTQELVDTALKEAKKCKEITNDEEKYIKDTFMHDMDYSLCETISNMPHFYIKDSVNYCVFNSVASENKTDEEVFKKFDEYSTSLGRTYELCVMYAIEKMNLN